MKNKIFIAACLLVYPILCVAQGVSNISENKTIMIKGAAYSTPIKTDDNRVVIATHKRSIYFLQCDESTQSKPIVASQYHTKFWVHATPSIVYDSLVAIGSYDGNFYFFNQQGVLQKKIRPKGRIYTNPEQLNHDWIVFGVGYKGLRYYNLATDSIFTAKTRKLTHGSPTVLGNGAVCIGSNDKNIYFFDDEGKRISTYKTKGWIMHSKALPLSDTTIVIGSYDNNLYAVSSSGNLLWKYQTKGKIHASPKQFANGNIICGSFDKHIYVLNEFGEKIASVETGKRVVSSACIYGDMAVVGSYDGNLYFITSQGKLVDTVQLGGKIFSSPIVMDDGTIFCATTNGKAVFVAPR